MTSPAETMLHDLLEAQDGAPPLDAGRIIRSARRGQRRRRVGGVATACVLATGATVAVVSQRVDGPVTAGAPAAQPTMLGADDVVVAQLDDDWKLTLRRLGDESDGGGLGLCLVRPVTNDTFGGCVVAPRFSPGKTVAWWQESDDEPVFVWLVRDGTTSAEIQLPDGQTAPATIHRIDQLGVTVAAVSGVDPSLDWVLISRNRAHAVTDHVEQPGIIRNGPSLVRVGEPVEGP